MSRTTITRIARVPSLNSAPFFRGLSFGAAQQSARHELIDCAPRELGRRAAAGELLAGLLPLVDYFRLEDTFERLGPFGIAVRGRAQSVVLFSRKPIRQLQGSVIAVTEETSTSAVLLRLILEQRYELRPSRYVRGNDEAAEALLLIGDAALRFQQTNTQYPFEIDLAFEWWLWQHLPCVFAVWAIRHDAEPAEKKSIETALSRSLAMNMPQLARIAEERSASLGLPATALQAYLARFLYRLSRLEEEGIARFRELVTAHQLL